MFCTLIDITSHGKRDFAGVIKVKDLEMETVLDYPGGSNLITKPLKPSFK